MPAKVFVDANILVYAWDRREPEKQGRAVSLLNTLTVHRAVTVSTQVLGEFFRVTTNRLRPPVPLADALYGVETYLSEWEVLAVTPDVVLTAAQGVIAHLLAYWDAQIWAAARLNGISFVLTEDFQGRVLDGVRFLDPFSPSFDLDAVLAEACAEGSAFPCCQSPPSSCQAGPPPGAWTTLWPCCP